MKNIFIFVLLILSTSLFGQRWIDGVWYVESNPNNISTLNIIDKQGPDRAYNQNTGDFYVWNPIDTIWSIIPNTSYVDAADSVLNASIENQYGEMFITPSNIDTLIFVSGSTDTLQLTSPQQGLTNGFSVASGTLTYTGTDTIVANVQYNLSFSFTEGADVLGAIYINNLKTGKSEFRTTIKTANDFEPASASVLYQLAPNDEIRFYLEVSAHSGTDELIIREFDLNAIEIN